MRWWDPSATNGPTDGGDLPMSQELRDELLLLRKAFASAEDDGLGAGEDAFERMGNEWERSELNKQALALWRRARVELGHRYTVGFLGAGMQHPCWSPSEIEDDGSEYADMPF